MTRSPAKSVNIAESHDRSVLSAAQKAFNTLVEQIEKRRERLGAWDAVTPAIQKKFLDELLPLEQTSIDLRIRMVCRLDEASYEKGLTASEQRNLSALITALTGQLLAVRDDAQLKAIYDHHSQSDDSEVVTPKREKTSDVVPDTDLDPNSPEVLLEQADAWMKEQEAREMAEHEAREARRAKRKKSAKQTAEAGKQKDEQMQLSQSIRAVYRKLASALHPDREPDPQERERKTALMQRVNQAYDRNNLLQLLELQLELEHIDQHAINHLSEDRLRHYNSILKDQLRELDQEIQHVETRFRQTYGISPFVDIAPDTIIRRLAGDIASLRQGIHEMERDLRLFEDIKTIKPWLKQLQR